MKTLDLKNFWKEPNERTENNSICDPVSDEVVDQIERVLGYKLPNSYIELMKTQNGGEPINRCIRTNKPGSSANDYLMITTIFGIGFDKALSMCGHLGSRHMIDEWGYPEIGIYFADTPSGGHDMLCLDYSLCGPEGEPRVVHVSEDNDYRITILADNFNSFIRNLVNAEEFL